MFKSVDHINQHAIYDIVITKNEAKGNREVRQKGTTRQIRLVREHEQDAPKKTEGELRWSREF